MDNISQIISRSIGGYSIGSILKLCRLRNGREERIM